MKTINYLLVVLVFALFSCNTEGKKEEATSKEELAVVEETSKEVEKTIFEKLGGDEGVSAIVEDIIAKHLENDKIKHYFIALQKDPEYFEKFKQHVKDFLETGTGGEQKYSGRDMVAAHSGLNISESDFLEAIDDILFVLDSHKVDRTSRNELLATLYSMKDAVMKK
ncbi:group I truncated hemoglobin [Pontimicrobium sp. IMCC45349]|uniref:group I truncated hemoglobin n=1 Tax=Pontimicrobium sp. IMCC45349 TaxID=3391574 RepID=UPI0039A30C95